MFLDLIVNSHPTLTPTLTPTSALTPTPSSVSTSTASPILRPTVTETPNQSIKHNDLIVSSSLCSIAVIVIGVVSLIVHQRKR